MSVDLTVASLAEPDIEAAQRLARCALGPRYVQADLVGILLHVPEAGHHEFIDEHVLGMTPHAREPGVYMAMVVLAAAIAVLYEGRLIDEAGFFPTQDAREVLRFCFDDSPSSAEGLWQAMISGSKL